MTDLRLHRTTSGARVSLAHSRGEPEHVLSATSTDEAPWCVVPANHQWSRSLGVADWLVPALEDMDPRPPKIHGMDWQTRRRAVPKTSVPGTR